MKSKEKTVYYCEFCKKHGLSKHHMIRHELLCYANPENDRPCFNCGNLIKKEAVISETYYNGTECIRKVDLLFCKYHKFFIHTPQNDIKGNAFDTDEPNEPMPKQCDGFEKPYPFNF